MILENRDLDLAVAVGAAYYSYVKATGAGLLVRGGLPRSYYVGVGDNEAVCLVPRGAEEGQTMELIVRICIWWPTGPCRSVCTVR